jgi:hypothetical protein
MDINNIKNQNLKKNNEILYIKNLNMATMHNAEVTPDMF